MFCCWDSIFCLPTNVASFFSKYYLKYVGSTWWRIICALFWPRNMVIAMRLYWNQNATKGILNQQKKMSQTNNLWIKPLTCIPATIEPHPKVKWSKALFFHTTAIKRQLKKTITFRSRDTAGFLLRLLHCPCKCSNGFNGSSTFSWVRDWAR